ncbi:MAG: hypothetical protein WCP67_09695 [Verrucomicrobiota bacterium]|jgi:hypothetical protein
MSTLSTVESNDYVLLPDGTVARKLKPTLTKEKIYWFLSIGGKVVRFSAEDVVKVATPISPNIK